MNSLYALLGISKQAHFKARSRLYAKEVVESQVITSAQRLRETHPGMGCRSMYDVIGEQHSIGRDGFEAILLSNGFRVRFPRNYVKTTRSVKSNYFDNLIRGLQLNGVNQLWQSDIAYIWVNGRFYYLVFIVDVYSRRILGYQANANMLARANIKALHQALKARAVEQLPGLIHHSDRGSQYMDKRYLKALERAQITPSMAKECWENAYVERVNGTIKNQYLNLMDINSLPQLRSKLKRVVDSYNREKPHKNLPGKLSPIDFEAKLKNGSITPPLQIIYNPELSTIKQLSTKRKRSKKKKITSTT